MQAHAAPGASPVLSEAADVTLESLSRQAGWDDESFVEGSRLRSEGQVAVLAVGSLSCPIFHTSRMSSDD